MKQIIVVDDEPAMVRMTEKTMERLGLEVTGMTDPVEALDLIQSSPEKFDVMITDMAMPGMDGAQLSRAVLKIRPDLPILLCSGYCSLTREAVEEIGIRKFFAKPVALVDLANAVQDVLYHKA